MSGCNITVEDTEKHMQLVQDALKRANKYHLSVEVVTFALEAVKSKPSLPIADALEYAMREWDV